MANADSNLLISREGVQAVTAHFDKTQQSVKEGAKTIVDEFDRTRQIGSGRIFSKPDSTLLQTVTPLSRQEEEIAFYRQGYKDPLPVILAKFTETGNGSEEGKRQSAFLKQSLEASRQTRINQLIASSSILAMMIGDASSYERNKGYLLKVVDEFDRIVRMEDENKGKKLIWPEVLDKKSPHYNGQLMQQWSQDRRAMIEENEGKREKVLKVAVPPIHTETTPQLSEEEFLGETIVPSQMDETQLSGRIDHILELIDETPVNYYLYVADLVPLAVEYQKTKDQSGVLLETWFKLQLLKYPDFKDDFAVRMQEYKSDLAEEPRNERRYAIDINEVTPTDKRWVSLVTLYEAGRNIAGLVGDRIPNTDMADLYLNVVAAFEVLKESMPGLPASLAQLEILIPQSWRPRKEGISTAESRNLGGKTPAEILEKYEQFVKEYEQGRLSFLQDPRIIKQDKRLLRVVQRKIERLKDRISRKGMESVYQEIDAKINALRENSQGLLQGNPA